VSPFIENLTDRDTPERKARIEKLREKLLAALGQGGRVISDFDARRIYSRDMADVPPLIERGLFRTTPLLVVQPREPSELLRILDFAEENRLPVYPRGAASWGLGGAVPTANGLVVDFSLMNRIIELDAAEKIIWVQSGTRWGTIDEFLDKSGLSIPVTPSSRFSTVGGWLATGGLGLNSTRLGHLRQWVRAIEVATPGKGMLRLERGDPDFHLFFDTEGQIGLISSICLELISSPPRIYPHLLYFNSVEEAFSFASLILKNNCVPLHMKFLESALISEHSELMRRKKEDLAGLLEKKNALLLAMDDAATEELLTGLIREFPGVTQAPPHAAGFLWHERYSPLKIQILGPSLLASEVIIPLARAPEYIRRARTAARHYKVELLFETHFVRSETGFEILIMAMFNCDRRNLLQYMAYLSLVPMLTRLGIRCGGRPYGIGIWNVPFFASKFPADEAGRIIAGKRKYDPENLLNPRKFLSIKSRFMNLPARLFHPLFFNFSMDAMLLFSPLIGLFLRPLGLHLPRQENLLERSSLVCTQCGNCLAVCPAYTMTGDERTGPRSKLRLARQVLASKKIEKHQSDCVFLCTRCGRCEEVCQALISHREAWDLLEKQLEDRFGRPVEDIEKFVDGLRRNEDYLRLIGSKPY
jgi:FAD/FMN-containing dehydrogenase